MGYEDLAKLGVDLEVYPEWLKLLHELQFITLTEDRNIYWLGDEGES